MFKWIYRLIGLFSNRKDIKNSLLPAQQLLLQAWVKYNEVIVRIKRGDNPSIIYGTNTSRGLCLFIEVYSPSVEVETTIKELLRLSGEHQARYISAIPLDYLARPKSPLNKAALVKALEDRTYLITHLLDMIELSLLYNRIVARPFKLSDHRKTETNERKAKLRL